MEKLNPKIAKRKAVEAEPKGSDYYYNPSTREMELKSDPSPHRPTLQAAKKAAYNNPNAKYVSKEHRIYEALKVPGYEIPEKSNASYKKLKEIKNKDTYLQWNNKEFETINRTKKDIAWNSTAGKIFKDDPNVQIPQKDLVNQLQNDNDLEDVKLPIGLGKKSIKSDPRTPNQKKFDNYTKKKLNSVRGLSDWNNIKPWAAPELEPISEPKFDSWKLPVEKDLVKGLGSFFKYPKAPKK